VKPTIVRLPGESVTLVAYRSLCTVNRHTA
jgi:hypothetical protein